MLRRIGRWAVTAVVVAAASFALVTHGAVVVAGGSMEPSYSPGDVVIYSRVMPPSAGRAVVYRRGGIGAPVLHRIVAETDDGTFVTRGDANPVPDLDPVSMSEVSGVAWRVVPIGRLMRVVATQRR